VSTYRTIYSSFVKHWIKLDRKRGSERRLLKKTKEKFSSHSPLCSDKSKQLTYLSRQIIGGPVLLSEGLWWPVGRVQEKGKCWAKAVHGHLWENWGEEDWVKVSLVFTSISQPRGNKKRGNGKTFQLRGFPHVGMMPSIVLSGIHSILLSRMSRRTVRWALLSNSTPILEIH